MTVGELRRRLAPLTDECPVLLDGIADDGRRATFSEIDTEYQYNVFTGEGSVVINYDSLSEVR